MIVRSPRRVLTFLVIVLAGIATIAVPAIRTPVLRAAGWALVADDSVGPADLIVVTADAGAAGVLEAANLVHRGIATRVAVFADPTEDVDREFNRRGIPNEDWAARSVRQLESLGVTRIERIPSSVGGTEDEARALLDWCNQDRIHSVVVVSSSDHSRRLRRVLLRAMKGQQTKVMVRFARFSQFDPDRWWQTRGGIRTEIIELEKLLLDVARHPFS